MLTISVNDNSQRKSFGWLYDIVADLRYFYLFDCGVITNKVYSTYRPKIKDKTFLLYEPVDIDLSTHDIFAYAHRIMEELLMKVIPKRKY